MIEHILSLCSNVTQLLYCSVYFRLAFILTLPFRPDCDSGVCGRLPNGIDGVYSANNIVCMQTRVIVSYLLFDVDAHLVPSHTCYVIYVQSNDRRKLAMLPTCRRVAVSNVLCYLHAGEWPSQAFYANYMQASDRFKLSMLLIYRLTSIISH